MSKNVNIKFDIFSYFYRFAVLHNTQPVLLYIFTFGQRNSKAATSASLSRPPISVLMQAALPLPRIVPLLNDSHVFCVGIRLSSSLYSLPLPLSCRQNLCLSVSSGVSSYLLPHLCHAPNCCTGGSNIPLSAFLPR